MLISALETYSYKTGQKPNFKNTKILHQKPHKNKLLISTRNSRNKKNFTFR